MDNDYSRALSSFSSQMNSATGYAQEKQEQIGQYSENVKQAVNSVKKLQDGKTTNEMLGALVKEGSAAGLRYLKQQLVKTDAEGNLSAPIGKNVAKIDKFKDAASDALKTLGRKVSKAGRSIGGKSTAEDIEADSLDIAPDIDETAADSLASTTGIVETGAAAGGAAKSASSAAADAAEAALASVKAAGADAEGAISKMVPDEFAEGGAYATDTGEVAEQAAAAATKAASKVALKGAQDAAQAALTGSSDVEITGADQVIDFGEGLGEDVLKQVGTSAVQDAAGGIAEGTGAALEAAGTALDLTGVGAAVGVVLNIAGAADLAYGAYSSGKGIYDFVKDDLFKSGQKAAAAGVKKVSDAAINLGNQIAIPTYDTSINIHSGGAW
mgnify:CR=1 FL=1